MIAPASDRLHAHGWAKVDGALRPDECDELRHVCEARRWPDIPDALVSWIVDPRWALLALPFLGPDVRFVREQLVTKAPRAEVGVPWHQDSGYARVTGELLTLFVALDDVTPDNGCLWLADAPPERTLAPHEPAGNWRRLTEADDDAGHPVPQACGDVLAFSSLTPHRSGGNRTDGIRPVWMLQLGPADVRDRATGGDPAGCPRLAEGGVWLDRPRF